jgi:hypothetical protein
LTFPLNGPGEKGQAARMRARARLFQGVALLQALGAMGGGGATTAAAEPSYFTLESTAPTNPTTRPSASSNAVQTGRAGYLPFTSDSFVSRANAHAYPPLPSVRRHLP